MNKLSDKSETEVLSQLKTSISRFIERIGQEVQQLHQVVENLQRELKAIKTKNDVQLIELTSRISNLENSVSEIEQASGKPFLGALATRAPAKSQEVPSSPTQEIPQPIETPAIQPQIDEKPISSELVSEKPTGEVEKKEEKRELLKALQLIDSL